MTDPEELFHGDSKECFIRILGQTYFVDPKCLRVKFLVYDLDENGNPQKDDDGNAKTKEITYIVSIDIHKPKDVNL